MLNLFLILWCGLKTHLVGWMDCWVGLFWYLVMHCSLFQKKNIKIGILISKLSLWNYKMYIYLLFFPLYFWKTLIFAPLKNFSVIIMVVVRGVRRGYRLIAVRSTERWSSWMLIHSLKRHFSWLWPLLLLLLLLVDIIFQEY